MINNYCHLEPTMKTLNVKFDSNTAHDIMVKKEGVALNILHQLKNVAQSLRSPWKR
jgi:hypothetical protein